ncbi:MAG: response regulator transcription factor [Acidimicrobiales bacterium]
MEVAVGVEGGRVLLVEDDSAVRDAVEIAFQGEGYDVRAEADGSDISRIVASFHPDIAILDLRLPTGPDGYAMARQLRQLDDLPVVLLTSADSLDDRLNGFRAGADDYLSKPFSMSELLARVQALLRRSGRVSDGPLSVGDIVIDDGTRVVSRGGDDIDLTRTEYDLLMALCRRPGQVLSKLQLMDQVWGGFESCGDNVVEVHVSALRRKLEAHGPRLLQTVRGVGYVLRV